MNKKDEESGRTLENEVKNMRERGKTAKQKKKSRGEEILMGKKKKKKGKKR